VPLFDLATIGEGLPFAEALPQLREAITARGVAVVQAPPGSGKTTLAPPLLATQVTGRVVVTGPRRVTVRSAARRLAHLTGTPLGELVGYTVRGERHVQRGTRIEFVTPGVLVRRLLSDPELTGTAAVVLDEIHERALDTDLLLGMLAEVRQLRDLPLIAMSATLDAPGIARVLDDAPVVDSEGALHPLAITWEPATLPRTDARGVTREFLDHVARTAARHHDSGGDTLVFVPGAREVDRVVEQLRGLAPAAEVLPLHGRLAPRDQDRATGERRGDSSRIIVSTDLAESSLTVPGVRLVIDAALSREPRRDAARDMSGLVTVQASRASMTQRAGRAARLGPGRAVRLIEESVWSRAPEHVTPQITTADLTETALTLAAWGSPRGDGHCSPRLRSLRSPLPRPDCADSGWSTTPAGSPPLARLPPACPPTRGWPGPCWTAPRSSGPRLLQRSSRPSPMTCAARTVTSPGWSRTCAPGGPASPPAGAGRWTA
jgi:ATP-dependent helicase HrpB